MANTKTAAKKYAGRKTGSRSTATEAALGKNVPRKREPVTLVLDVGGTHVKGLATGQNEPFKFESGKEMTPEKMVAMVKTAAAKWNYSRISIGYPGPVVDGSPLLDPFNLGPGWVRFDFEKAFGCPVKLINDAAMQAMGSYEGGRMLFLGLGTGLGTAMIIDGKLEPLELAHLTYKKGLTFEDFVGIRGLQKYGKKRWRKYVRDVVQQLSHALATDYVVIGGGNSRLLDTLPEGSRLGENANAFKGGLRLWEDKKAAS
jgi:predicted NBD/HSP70 family sugar kinase